LLCSSLPEGYAFNKASQVLIQTGRLQKDVSRRIYETGQMLHNIAGPDGLRPGGIGHRTLMEVRLLHAAVRYFIELRGGWDFDKYEKPINQEDMAGTVLEFDFMVVRGMKKLGLFLSEEQRVSMHYFWRYAGYLLGVREALLTESYQEQEILALSLFTHLYSPTEDGKKLVHALLQSMSGKPPFNFPVEILYSISNYLMGDLVANDLDIRSTVAGRAVVEAIKASVRAMSAANRFMPDFVLKRMEKDSLAIGRRALQQGLGNDPVTWAFKAMA
ncbi:MAG TPA: oxygenase MpaB family protein, partial [Pseudomonadales bacterium]|nr:oxygenase MpaB family protein [Pseudomonadales bacterium]